MPVVWQNAVRKQSHRHFPLRLVEDIDEGVVVAVGMKNGLIGNGSIQHVQNVAGCREAIAAGHRRMG
jgi:hypothetical protein